MPAKAIFTSPKWRINEFASSVKNEFKGAEIFWMLQTAYGDAVMSRRRVFEWYKRFKEGREETADNERSGRPSTSTTPEKVDKVLELVHEDRRITVREVAEEAGISFGSTKSIMKDKTAGASWILHHDNAPAHTALKILKFLQDHSTSEFPQTPYSPDLAPCDFFIFGKLQKKLKGRKFQSKEEIKVESKKAMKAIPKTDYQRCFADWKKRWLKCIAANGDYFEGDNLKILYNNKVFFFTYEQTRWSVRLNKRYAIKICVRLGKNATETFQMLQKAFKDDCISRSQSGKWHKAFKEGREEVADEPRSGRPTTARTDENVNRVLEVLRTDRRLNIQQIADTLHMSTFVVHGIVTEDLQMRKVCAKLVPKVLAQDQRDLRVLRCQELLDLIQNEPDFLNSVVTGDESWMFEYDPESKRQSCAWHTNSSPRPKKARMSKSRIKTMIIVFFDIRGIVHCEFVPQGQTVNSAFYLEVLRRLKRRIARVRTDIKDTVKLHHDNATSHTAFIIANFLARSNTTVIPHPPYSPDLAPCKFFLFPRLKREMKGKHWEAVENIQHHVTTFLRSIPIEEFQGAFQSCQTRLRKCIDAGGMYSEEY
ncbi:hypothetical protein LAZ67_12000508 [Cordylochernes scorpioides]|uniref:Mos1 transposase HTH domain-containing protein n=1 Tax=Cordylochernes scorpioides TaxID=51811 RepID=A0ABY6L123_9ARAC|nr:hypothetical protein LAZ67_12000508 [Cordylochernes scorpioides]